MLSTPTMPTKMYEPSEKELELLRKLTAIVLDGPNVNKGALKEFEKNYPWVSYLICACRRHWQCLSGFFKAVFKLPSVAIVFKLASDTGNKFRRCKWLREQLKHHVDNNPDIRSIEQFKTGISMYIYATHGHSLREQVECAGQINSNESCGKTRDVQSQIRREV